MANNVFLSGLIRVEHASDVKGLGMTIQATVIEQQNQLEDSWDEVRLYPVLLAGKQAEILAKQSNHDRKGLPHAVISGRLFRADGNAPCFVLCKYIQFTGMYGQV